MAIKRALITFAHRLARGVHVASRLALQVMHRDIKPRNVFIHKGVLKLGDLGLSKQAVQGAAQKHTVCGSPIYAAPSKAPTTSRCTVVACAVALQYDEAQPLYSRPRLIL